MPKIEHEYEADPVCPNCGHKLSDAWELSGEDGEIECDCGVDYVWVRHVTVAYSTSIKPTPP